MVPLDGYQWVTYREIEEKGLLDDVVKREWTDKRRSLPDLSALLSEIT